MISADLMYLFTCFNSSSFEITQFFHVHVECQGGGDSEHICGTGTTDAGDTSRFRNYVRYLGPDTADIQIGVEGELEERQTLTESLF